MKREDLISLTGHAMLEHAKIAFDPLRPVDTRRFALQLMRTYRRELGEMVRSGV